MLHSSGGGRLSRRKPPRSGPFFSRGAALARTAETLRHDARFAEHGASSGRRGSAQALRRRRVFKLGFSRGLLLLGFGVRLSPLAGGHIEVAIHRSMKV